MSFPNIKCSLLYSLILSLVMVMACSSTPGTRSITVDRIPIAHTYMPGEISELLSDLGYQHMPLKDPLTDHYMDVIQKFGEYWMMFKASDQEDIRILVKIKQQSGSSTLHFYQDQNQALSAEAESRFKKVVELFSLAFGRSNLTIR